MNNDKCVFCDKQYANKKILINHQKTAKFCIDIQNKSKNNTNITQSFQCEYCNDDFTQKSSLERHYETCKLRQKKIKEENDQKKDELIFKLQSELHILMTQTYPEREAKWKDELNTFKIENLVLKTELKIKDEQHEKELKMKDEIILKLENKVDSTYSNTTLSNNKLLDSIINIKNGSSTSLQGNSTTTNNNNYTINNTYNIKPLTTESVINAFEAYNSNCKTAFLTGYIYDANGISEQYPIEDIFYGITRELKEYYGISDVSREKIIYNNNGDMTSTTIKDFIRKNIILNNIDEILEWISNLKTLIFTKMEEGFTMTNEGEMRDLTLYDRNQLKLKIDGLNVIYNMFLKSVDKKEVNIYLEEYMSEGAMKHGIAIEKVVTNKVRSEVSKTPINKLK